MSCLLTDAFPKLTRSVPTSTPFPPTAIVVPQITSTILPVPDDALIITYTEADVNRWITEFQNANSSMSIQDPVVILDNNLCTIQGTFQSGFIKGNLVLSFSVKLDEAGTPVISIDTMQLGGVDLPDSIKESITTSINQSITSSIMAGLEGNIIQSITIDDGFITILATK